MRGGGGGASACECVCVLYCKGSWMFASTALAVGQPCICSDWLQ